MTPAARGTGPDENARHLTTEHLQANLKGRTISSGFVTTLSQGVQFAVNLASVMVLARLLTPADFGLVAMVATVMGFLRFFNEAGLSTATIQRENITHAQVSNLFWANVALGGTGTLLLALSAPAVAWFFREPRLVGITLALCVTFLLTSSAVQHKAILKRQMRFRTIAYIEITALTVGVAVGISMASFNYGYWSLVGMQLSTPIVACWLAWRVSRWRPQRPTRHSGTRPLLSFGANLTASSFLYSLARGSDSLLIGRFHGSGPLGLYTRAAVLLSRPVQQAIGPLEAVFVPMLSRLQNQPDRYRRTLLQAYEAIAVGSFLFTGLFFALATPLTLVVLGPKWAEAAPILVGFSLVALYIPVHSVGTWPLTSQGRGKDFLVTHSILSSFIVVSFLVGLPFGPVGVAISYSGCCILVGLPVLYYIAGRRGPVTTRDLWSRFFRHLPLWFVVCGVAWLARTAVSELPPLAQLLIGGAAGFLGGLAFVLAYPPSRRTAASVCNVLRHWRENRSAKG